MDLRYLSLMLCRVQRLKQGWKLPLVIGIVAGAGQKMCSKGEGHWPYNVCTVYFHKGFGKLGGQMMQQG